MFDEISGQTVYGQKNGETDALPSSYAKPRESDGWHVQSELPAGLYPQKTPRNSDNLVDGIFSAQTLKMTGTDDLPTDNARVFANMMEHETGSSVKVQMGEYGKENALEPSGTSETKHNEPKHNVNTYALVPTHSQISSNNRLKKLTSDIKEKGILEPIKYIEYNGEKYVVDGHHRLLAA